MSFTPCLSPAPGLPPDKTYWSEGYTLSREEQCVPAFVAPALAQHIFTCGKALNLLKLCSPQVKSCDGHVTSCDGHMTGLTCSCVLLQHYILDPSIKPPLFGVVFAQEALEDIERNCSVSRQECTLEPLLLLWKCVKCAC